MDADIGDTANSICDVIGTLQNGIAEFDDNVGRQLIDTIRVVDNDRISVAFKGGVDVEYKAVK